MCKTVTHVPWFRYPLSRYEPLKCLYFWICRRIEWLKNNGLVVAGAQVSACAKLFIKSERDDLLFSHPKTWPNSLFALPTLPHPVDYNMSRAIVSAFKSNKSKQNVSIFIYLDGAVASFSIAIAHTLFHLLCYVYYNYYPWSGQTQFLLTIFANPISIHSHRDGVDMKIGRRFLSLINVNHIAKLNIDSSKEQGNRQKIYAIRNTVTMYVLVSQANVSNFIFMGIYFIRQINNSFIYK